MTTAPEKHTFQAEIAQLLDLVVHSLYTDKEIFVRELVSNAADASEKLKFLQTSGVPIFQPEAALKIAIATDDTAKTITFTDAGVGMTHGELIDNLGTIAHSGSRAFLEQMKAARAAQGDAEKREGDAHLIGQFGVGFYSAFMVAESVTVWTRSHAPEEQGWKWTSDGQTGYEIEPAEGLDRGTRIELRLRDDEFARASRVEGIIRRYSAFVPFPIELNGTVVNTVQAIWTKQKSELTDADYEGFYQFIAHDSDAPLFRHHAHIEGKVTMHALLFVPARSTELLTMTRGEPEVHLYSRKVLIQQRAVGLVPEWLRFLRGVVDSEDIPLNISRETMQDSALLAVLRDTLTKRTLKWLEDEAGADAEKFARFFKEHGHCLKEGLTTEYGDTRTALARLLRFESSHVEAGKLTSLPDYVSRMPEEQKEIYFLSALSRESAEASPYFEVFREKKFEVLFLGDPRDEFVMEHLREFDGKKVVAAEKADLTLDAPAERALSDDEARLLANFIKETLGDRVGEVRASKRLVGSPAAVVDADKHLTSSMRRTLRALGRDEMPGFDAKLDLEINANHAMLAGMEKLRHRDTALAAQLAEQVFDNALLSGGLLEDPRTMLARLNGLLEKLVAEK